MRLKFIYEQDPNIGTQYSLIDLDTQEDILQKNMVCKIKFEAGADGLPKLYIELQPEYMEIEINGKIEQKIRRAKLK
jgi:hypothetical protein